MAGQLAWYAVNATSHESYTRLRYSVSHSKAIAAYEWLHATPVQTLPFGPDDEAAAVGMLRKYHDHSLSFHDALCAAVMLRIGVFKVFTFDSDFSTMGFAVVPGAAS
jgi:predicted nucleic acid-binding protein